MPKQCANQAANKTNCPCTYETCGRRGMCCECLRHHLANGELPACCFPPEVEKTFDRSIEKFVEINKSS